MAPGDVVCEPGSRGRTTCLVRGCRFEPVESTDDYWPVTTTDRTLDATDPPHCVHTTDQLNTALAGRYAIERLVGEGGMATVYLARDLRHNRKVALKVLKPDLGAVVGVERFLAEIEVTANLQLAYADASKGVGTQEDLADYATDDLIEATGLPEERAKALIMAARAPWFAENNA